MKQVVVVYRVSDGVIQGVAKLIGPVSQEVARILVKGYDQEGAVATAMALTSPEN